MYLPASFVLAALPFLVTARTQLKTRQDLPSTYTMTAIHSGDESVHNQPIVAAERHFYIGRNSTARCINGASLITCPTTYPTQLEIADTRAALDVVVPAGQSVYVDKTGALAFTAPHADTIAGENDGFSLDPSSADTSVSVHNLVYSSNGSSTTTSGWLACPYQNVYQIFANITGVQIPGTGLKSCHGIAVALMPGVPNQMPYEFE